MSLAETIAFMEAEAPWFFPVFVTVFGACVGSFLNVCIYRIPAGRSVVHPGSTCACGKPIAWHDNIPVLSWLLLRGRARCCGRSYGIRYPFIEALVAGLFLAAWLTHPPAVAACLWVLVALLVTGAFIDLDHMIIPDRCTLGATLAGAILSFAVPALHGHGDVPFAIGSFRSVVEGAQGALVGSALILWIGIAAEAVLRREAMGFADVKLLGGIGAFLGIEGALFAIFGGAMLGSVAVLGMRLFGVKLGAVPPATEPASGEAQANPDEDSLAGREVPFGPMLAAGALIYALALRGPVDAWFAELSWFLHVAP